MLRAAAQLAVLLAALAAAPAGAQRSCPSSCYCDAQLNVNCVGDTIWRFPDGIPDGVTRLELRNYVIPTLGAAQLADFANLTELKAPQNKIGVVEEGTFQALAALRKLDLSQNEIATVSPGTFAGLTAARNLDLSSNELRECEGAFASMTSLEQLTLRSNNLTRLGPHTLDGLEKLQYLNVDSNTIAEIDVAAFQGLTSLAHLILSNNPLSNLSRLEFFGSRLQYIDVSAVGLTRIPQSLTQYVRDLRLAKNNFTALRRGDFDSYPYLGLLVLDDSGVTELEEDALGRHEYLMRLWMNGNKLQRVPTSLPSSLKALYLEENQITALRADEFQGLVKLEQLFLQRNKIALVEDCAFCGLGSLQNLDLQANRITRLSARSFSGLIALESLDLSQNPLTVIEPGAFAPFLAVTSLRMSRIAGNVSLPDSLFNALERLDRLELLDSPRLVERVLGSGQLLHGIRSVQQLNIMHNELQRLRADLPRLLPRLQLLKLGGSRWDCSDPDIMWLKDWMAEGSVQFYSPFSARCRRPQRLLLKSVALLQDSDFDPQPGDEEDPDSADTAEPAAQDGESSGSGEDMPPPTTQATASPAESQPERTNPSLTTTTTSAATTSTSTTTARPVTTTTSTTTTTTSTTTTTVSTTSPTTTRTTTARPSTSTSRVTSPPPSPTQSPTTPPPTEPTRPAPLPTTTVRWRPSSTRRPTPPALPPLTGRQSVVPTHTDPEPEPPVAQPGRVNFVPSGARGTMTALVGSMAAAVGVILALLAGAVCLWRYRKGAVYPFSRRRKDSSISYSQQKDEVNITPEESGGADGGSGDTHHGLTNALYYLAQHGETEFPEPTRPRPGSLLPHSGVDACPGAVPDAWSTPSPDASRW
ncbi:leucine-rich repeat-containing protein 4C-like [Amphibalanus amphitrite]|uniref:leucine-rich repeat-containing protein 4C-like n=1 Tax=Amphibalanus amphitrite TaxID=1232801 RepID=UPI001C91B575|nr:leucine-rich repeat-containing protein 4C-like [Amphibalanus amphitrite]